MKTIGYTFDDGGRAATGRKGQKAGDCVARALAILTGRPYEDCYSALAAANQACTSKRNPKAGRRTASNGVSKIVYEKVYREFGLEKIRLPVGPRPTLGEAYATYGDLIATTARHIMAVVGGDLRDIADCRYYDFADEWGTIETRERKAQSVWVRKPAKVDPERPTSSTTADDVMQAKTVGETVGEAILRIGFADNDWHYTCRPGREVWEFRDGSRIRCNDGRFFWER